jgi:DNA-directed RNA polymerase subunit RPC12/RpoP
MKKNDVICHECGAGFRRLELQFAHGSKGEYRCPTCGALLEVFDGSKLVAYRLTVQPAIKALRD